MVATVIFYLGALILILLSLLDFRKKVNKGKGAAPYYTSMGLFIFINLVIYSMLCFSVMKLSPRSLLLAFANGTGDAEKDFFPLFAALAYFGIGSLNIPLGDRVIGFYSFILELFQGIFRLKFIDLVSIQDDIDAMKRETEQLENDIDSFAAAGKSLGWNVLDEEWDDLKHDKDAAEVHIESLNSIREELGSGDITPDKAERMSAQLGTKVSQMTEETNRKLRKHFKALVIANSDNYSAIKSIMDLIGKTIPPDSGNLSAVSMNRALAFSIVAGAVIG
ncbi:hypothetical protein EG833_05135, partial [archaeon]|nr:hypothetical protein [archaeon]